MTERAYTVSEIDKLRLICDERWLTGTTFYHPELPSYGRSYKEYERIREVEEHVRTYMLAGILAEEIRASDRIQGEARLERVRKNKKEKEECEQKKSSEQQSQTPTMTSSITSSGVVQATPSETLVPEISTPQPLDSSEPGTTESTSATGATESLWTKIRSVFRAGLG